MRTAKIPGFICPAAMAALLGSACSGGQADGDVQGVKIGELESPLTRYTAVTLWDPEVPIDACFLADSADLPTHKEWIRADIKRSWEYVTPITVNWIDPCPATGWLIRIGLKLRTSATAEWAGAVNAGMDARRDEQATAGALVTSPTEIKPSIIYYLRQDLQETNRVRVGHLNLHEFGHILGFAHEQDHPDSTCTNGQTSPQTEITGYDADSVMSAEGYCHGDQDYLSHLDIVGAQSVYGVGPRYTATLRWFTAVSVLT